jgi:hypothetical protein
MEGLQFDSLARALSDVRSRRSLGRLVGALAVVGATSAVPLREATAGSKHDPKNKHKKRRRKKSPQTVPSQPGATCGGKLVSGRCVLDCGTTCQTKNGLCGVRYQDMNTLFCVPTVNSYCVEYPKICTQDAGCATTELCVKTICGPNQTDQGRCVPIFPPA